jgi:2-hydroxychromene-2-carboxylate isomerase
MSSICGLGRSAGNSHWPERNTHHEKNRRISFDVGSHYTYLAYHQLPKVAQSHWAEIVWTPVLLGGIFQATGNKSPAEVPAKGSYSHVDLQRWAREYGVSLKMNPDFPINALPLMRGAVAM